MGDRRLLGLCLIERRQRAATGPSDQDNLSVSERFARVPDVGAKIVSDLFHDQRTVVLRVAAARAQDMHAGLASAVGIGKRCSVVAGCIKR